jgi:hypothetical protein
MNRIFIFTMTLILSACVSTGKKVSMETVEQFEEGRTTYQEVIAKLGEPTQSTLNSDGTRSIIYSYSQAQSNPINFVPYARFLFGGSSSENSIVHMDFNKRGILMRYTASSGNSSTNTGLINGQRQ